MHHSTLFYSFFFFNDTATTEIYTLSLHDALPISQARNRPDYVTQLFSAGNIQEQGLDNYQVCDFEALKGRLLDRKSTRLNSSHTVISYAVFCLKKKKKR